MRVRTLTRWLSVVVCGAALVPSAAFGGDGTSAPLPHAPQDSATLKVVSGTSPRPVDEPIPLQTQTPTPGKPEVKLEPASPYFLPATHGEVLGTSICPALDGGMPPLSESATSFLDTALIGTHVRFRFEGRFNNSRPDRAAYIMTKTQEQPLPVGLVNPIPQGNGLPLSERRVNLETFSLYGEYALSTRCSLFGELPIRALQPDVNEDHFGMGDIAVGAKLAIFAQPDLVQTLQCRIYCPTGDPHEGMSSDLFAVEPAFLVYNRLTPRWILEGEIRDWIPIGDGEFAGSVLRYGITAAYDLGVTAGGWQVRPVAGLWGVAFLQGRQTVITPVGPILEDARERILNADIGVRVGSAQGSFYLGYSQVLSGSSLFEHEVRLDWRYSF